MLDNSSSFTPATPRPIVFRSEPDPLWLAKIEAADEAKAALKALEEARRALNLATHRHHQAVANAALTECKWYLGGDRP